ncbi:MAG: FAD-dependent oxidoreductase, partial [Duodenibacillus sp.]
MTDTFDLLVVGAGPGGYPAALRGAQMGLKTAVVDRFLNPDDGTPGAYGGTCANVGCIPSKALLAASKVYAETRGGLDNWGTMVAPESVTLDLARVQAHRARVVKSSNQGLASLFERSGITTLHGTARFTAAQPEGYRLEVDGHAVTARSIILACGTEARVLPGIEVDEQTILSNVGILALKTVPGRLGIIGAGVIGLEMASVWRRFGSEVRLFDVADRLLPAADADVAAATRRALEREGLVFDLKTRIVSVQKRPEGVCVQTESERGGVQEHVFDALLVAVGRRSVVADLAPEKVGLALDARGRIEVDDFCRTNLPRVWAVGDAVRGVQLAHKAHAEGVTAAEMAAGRTVIAPSRHIASVVYTEPEIAWVGQTAEEAQKAGRRVRVGRCPFVAN